MNPFTQVRDLEDQRDALLRAWREVWKFIETVGEDDQRSVGFIAWWVRTRMPHTYRDRRGKLRKIETGECIGS